eukprot:3967075-Prymnesium_polylepis.1
MVDQCKTGTPCLGSARPEHGTFCCPDIGNLAACYGATGLQVLDRLHQQFQVVDSVDRVWDDIGCLLIIAVVMKLAYTYNLCAACYPRFKIHPIPAPVGVLSSIRDTPCSISQPFFTPLTLNDPASALVFSATTKAKGRGSGAPTKASKFRAPPKRYERAAPKCDSAP